MYTSSTSRVIRFVMMVAATLLAAAAAEDITAVCVLAGDAGVSGGALEVGSGKLGVWLRGISRPGAWGVSRVRVCIYVRRHRRRHRVPRAELSWGVDSLQRDRASSAQVEHLRGVQQNLPEVSRIRELRCHGNYREALASGTVTFTQSSDGRAVQRRGLDLRTSRRRASRIRGDALLQSATCPHTRVVGRLERMSLLV
jgi:hypothetical protein